jgi:hypothetical protein
MEKLFEAMAKSAAEHGGLDLWFLFFLLAVAGVFYILKKNGVISIGKPVERRRCAEYCDQHLKVQADMKMASDDVARVENGTEKTIAEIKELLKEVFEKVNEMNKTLNDHIGYCRGVQDTKRK